ncbi:methyltransferase domain-containing protein [Eubacteriaceae bacterium ES3]|nr:methyltransferase domain-containing protein [Eubacteriaceae bacterium ES3]
MHLKKVFNEYSQDYDANRKYFIPLYETFYQAAVSLLNFKTQAPKILDLGAGTGLMSAFVLTAYPQAQITLIDQAGDMLDLARDRFAGNGNIQYIADDYLTHNYNEHFDGIVSALSIHHLEDQKKKQLYKNCFSSLKAGGIFVNADQVLSPDPQIETQIISIWHDFVKKSNVSQNELDSFYHRTSYDQTAPLFAQLNWLSELGFTKTDFIYKYLNFAVFFAIK